MKVYVVWEWYYDYGRVLGCFSSKTDVEQFRNMQDQDLCVDELEIDALVDKVRNNLIAYRCTKTNSEIKAHKNSAALDPFSNIKFYKQYRDYCYVWAENETKAVEQAKEIFN
jgi:hypothetical protein